MSGTQSKSRRLAQLFEAYAANLTVCDPSLKDTFVCPLCLCRFTRDAIESKALTEEHVISRKLGGRLITLTCKGCNSEGGSGLDSNLINEFLFWDTISGLGGKSFKGHVKARDSKQDVDIYFSSEGSPKMRLIGDEKRSNPASVRAIMQAMEKESTEVSFNVNFGFSRQRANVAKLRAAYLLMFRYFGYEYILHENVRVVRQQILSPDQDIVASKASVAFNHAPEELNGVSLLRSPSELRSFIVNFKVSTAVDRSFGVILPGLGCDGDSIYDRWHAAGETLKDRQFDVTNILPNPDAPSGHVYEGVVTSVWNSL